MAGGAGRLAQAWAKVIKTEDNKMQELLDWVPGVKEIAREAGRILHEIYHGGQFERQLKEDATPVTSADLAADAYLKQALSALTPHVPVLTEEAADVPFSQRANWRQYWLVDPLDGTGEFIAGSGDFATLLALVRDNVPVLGVIYAPEADVLYWAVRGHGARERERLGRGRAGVRHPGHRPLLRAGRAQPRLHAGAGRRARHRRRHRAHQRLRGRPARGDGSPASGCPGLIKSPASRK